MSCAMIGLSHQTGTPVEVRELVACTTPGSLSRALHHLRERLGHEGECVLLSTCNRTELYVAGSAADDLPSLLRLAFRVAFAERLLPDLTPYLVERRGHSAIQHLFRVTSGLDSMILGETDVVRQVKDAYRAATEAGTSGPQLNALFHEAQRVGKRARTETDMGRGAFSIGHAAAEVAANIFGPGDSRTVLILGAGKMSETTARHLTASGAVSVLVANRTFDRAAKLAEALNGRAIRYDEFGDYLARTDIVIASTASPVPVVTRSLVEGALKRRRSRDPLFFIDIAVPRDVEASVGDLPDVFLYNIDDLRGLVETDMAARRMQAARAETIVREESLQFAQKLRASRVAAPLVSSLRARARVTTEEELGRLRQRLPHLSDADMGIIEAAFLSLENRMLHDPTRKIKEYAASEDETTGAAKIETVRELFGLAPDEDGTPEATKVKGGVHHG